MAKMERSSFICKLWYFFNVPAIWFWPGSPENAIILIQWIQCLHIYIQHVQSVIFLQCYSQIWHLSGSTTQLRFWANHVSQYQFCYSAFFLLTNVIHGGNIFIFCWLSLEWPFSYTNRAKEIVHFNLAVANSYFVLLWPWMGWLARFKVKLSITIILFILNFIDRIRHYHTTDKWTMMFAMNAFSTFFLSLMLIASGELAAFFRFIAAYPTALQQIILFSIAGAVGQV